MRSLHVASESLAFALLAALSASGAGCRNSDDPVTTADLAASLAGVEIWVANQGASEILSYDLATGGLLGVILDADALGDPGFSPSALARDGERVLVADHASGDLLSLGEDGPETIWRNEGGVRIEEPCAVSVARGRTLVLGNDSRNVVLLGPEAEDRDEIGVDDPIRDPHGLEVLPSGLLAIATSPALPGLGLVQIRDPDTGERLADFAPWPELREATDVQLDGERLLVSDWLAGTVSAYTLSGERLGVLASGLDGPIALALAPDGTPLVLTRDAVLALPEGALPVPLVQGGERWLWARGLLVL